MLSFFLRSVYRYLCYTKSTKNYIMKLPLPSIYNSRTVLYIIIVSSWTNDAAFISLLKVSSIYLYTATTYSWATNLDDTLIQAILVDFHFYP